jgi:5'-3' exonuclease
MTTALIDLSAIFWRNWHATADEEMSSAGRKTLSLIQSLYNKHDEIKVVVDSPPYKRKEVYPEYKANREHPAAAIEELKKCTVAIMKDGWPVLGAEGAEADDVIATYIKATGPCTVYGTDKDLLQIEGIDLFDPFRNEHKTAEGKLGVRVDQVVDFLALVGDKSDNIPGIPGVGPKTAVKMLEKYGCLDVILNAVDDDSEPFTDKTRQSFKDNVEAVLMARRLIKLDYNCIIQEEKLDVEETQTDIVEDEMPECGEDAIIKPEPVQVPAAQIVKREQAYTTELEPTDWKEAFRVSTALHESGMWSRGFRNPASIMAVVMAGRELGIGAVTALNSMHVIQGKTTMSAALIAGLVMRSKECEYMTCTESTDDHATWVTKRVGSPKEVSRTFTIKEAQSMQLTGKDNWKKQPNVMLMWRCATALARMVYPDIVVGLYSTEEME